MKQASIHTEPTKYHYDNKTWLYNFMNAFFFGFVKNEDYTYDVKPTKKGNILPLSSYTYDAFSVLITDYNYFCGNMNKLSLQNGYFSVSAASSSVFWKHTATEFETGFDYFGARYYDSELSVWLSVDPLSDKYPSTSPFMYVLGNPTALIDPNGMNAWIPPTEKGGDWTAVKGYSPGSLARDAGISQSEAESVIRNHNKGKKRSSDIMVYTGDKVSIPGSGGDESSQESESSSGGTTTNTVSKANSTTSTMQNNNTDEHGRGHIISVSNGIAAFGPLGGMYDFGGAYDSYGDSKLYFTFGWAQGLGAGAGMGYGTTNKGFRTRDMNGWSSGWMASASYFTVEHFGDFEHGAIRDYTGNKMTYNGFSVGPKGVGLYHYFSYTVTMSPPSGEQAFIMVRHWH